MPGQVAHWPVSLDTRPVVLNMGVGVHGRTPVERYRLPGLWCMHLYGYTATLYVDEVRYSVRPGCVSIIPPGADMEYHFTGRSEHVYAHFELPASTSSTIGLSSGKVVPVVQDATGEFDVLYADFRQAIGYFAVSPLRAEVRLWDLLWRLADRRVQDRTGTVHRAVRDAVTVIEARMGDPIKVADLAREVGLSHNHLTRLFRATYGLTVSAYIRQQRVQHARHLLLHSTLPIKSIAIQVGIPDLHRFNKTIRSALHDSPRRIRQLGPPHQRGSSFPA
jgi:AraC family transcriptional regulator